MRASKPIGFKVQIIIEPDEGSFHAYCPALKGLHTCGTTDEEAFNNAVDAARAYLTSSIKHGDPIPVGIILHGESEESCSKPVTHRTEDVMIPCAI